MQKHITNKLIRMAVASVTLVTVTAHAFTMPACRQAAIDLGLKHQARNDYTLACWAQAKKEAKEAGVRFDTSMFPKAPESEWLGEPTFDKKGNQIGFSSK